MKIIRAAFVVSVLLFVVSALSLAAWAWVDRYGPAPTASCASPPVVVAEDP